MNSFFNLNGRVVNIKGDPISGIKVSIVDKDFFYDDLLGVGFTDSSGSFRIEFTEKEFNQNFFENEVLPDIYLVFSSYDLNEKKYKTVDLQEFFSLKFENKMESLGNIVIKSFDFSNHNLKNQDPTPGISKRVKRLNLDDELLSHCLTEVTPIVEYLTGWKDLLLNLNFKITNDFTEVFSNLMSINGSKKIDMFEKIIFKSISKGFLALYDPSTHCIYIHKDRVSLQNLDAVKVILGHELVHVGQFKYFPELIQEQRKAVQFLQSLETVEFDSISDFIIKFKDSEYNLFMQKIEGYAYYIQTEYLQNYYNCATFFEQGSIIQDLIIVLLNKLGMDLESVSQLKNSQYIEGRELFINQNSDGIAQFRI
jgi:hypothetical protein